MCGKVMQLQDLEKLMDEGETLFNIEGFNGQKDAQIDFDSFYKFMTSFLVQETEQLEIETNGEVEVVDESKKSESKSIESTNQSENRRNETPVNSDQDNLAAEKPNPPMTKKQLTIE